MPAGILDVNGAVLEHAVVALPLARFPWFMWMSCTPLPGLKPKILSVRRPPAPILAERVHDRGPGSAIGCDAGRLEQVRRSLPRPPYQGQRPQQRSTSNTVRRRSPGSTPAGPASSLGATRRETRTLRGDRTPEPPRRPGRAIRRALPATPRSPRSGAAPRRRESGSGSGHRRRRADDRSAVPLSRPYLLSGMVALLPAGPRRRNLGHASPRAALQSESTGAAAPSRRVRHCAGGRARQPVQGLRHARVVARPMTAARAWMIAGRACWAPPITAVAGLVLLVSSRTLWSSTFASRRWWRRPPADPRASASRSSRPSRRMIRAWRSSGR